MKLKKLLGIKATTRTKRRKLHTGLSVSNRNITKEQHEEDGFDKVWNSVKAGRTPNNSLLTGVSVGFVDLGLSIR